MRAAIVIDEFESAYLGQLETAVSSSLEFVQRRVIERLTERHVTLTAAGSNPFDLGDFNVMSAAEWAEAFEIDAADVIADVVVDAATGQPIIAGINVSDDVIIEMIARHVDRLRGLGGVVQASVSRTLQAAVANRTPFDTVVEQLQLAGPLGESSARMIARTELTAATNGGMLAGWRNDGIPFKRWHSLHDTRVRDAHLAIDGQVVPTEQDFEVGGARAQYPGDPRLPIDLRANCRCYMTRVGQNGQAVPARLMQATRRDLYRLAQELNIPGRSTMRKDELFRAIDRYRSGFGEISLAEMTRAQLLVRAKLAGIAGRWRMTKPELMSRLRARSMGRDADRVALDAGYAPSGLLDDVRDQVANLLELVIGDDTVVAAGAPGGDTAAGLRRAMFDRLGGKDHGWIPCVGCGAKLHHQPHPHTEIMTLVRADPGRGWNRNNVIPCCRADATTLTPQARTATFSLRPTQFANPWHDHLGRFAPKGTGRRGRLGPQHEVGNPDRFRDGVDFTPPLDVARVSDYEGSLQAAADTMAADIGKLIGEDVEIVVKGDVYNERFVASLRVFAGDPQREIAAVDRALKGDALHATELLVHRSLRGKGVGTVLVEGIEDWAVAHGAKMSFVTATHVGGYAWTRSGYDFHPSLNHRSLVTDLREAGFGELSDRLESDNPFDWPTPWEVSETPGTKPVLLASGWSGVKTLVYDEEGLAASGASRDRFELLRRVADAWSQWWPTHLADADPTNDAPSEEAHAELSALVNGGPVVASPGAAFANPWHDHIGRFAPKGTGRMHHPDSAAIAAVDPGAADILDKLSAFETAVRSRTDWGEDSWYREPVNGLDDLVGKNLTGWTRRVGLGADFTAEDAARQIRDMVRVPERDAPELLWLAGVEISPDAMDVALRNALNRRVQSEDFGRGITRKAERLAAGVDWVDAHDPDDLHGRVTPRPVFDTARARVLLDVAGAGIDQATGPVWRGSPTAVDLQVGDTFDIPLGSTSYDRRVAERFAGGKSRVVRFDGVSGIDVEKHTKSIQLEREFLLSGSFEVVDVTDDEIVARPRERAALAASAAQFANPWHDEMGRFAPKGQGKRSGFADVVRNGRPPTDFERVLDAPPQSLVDAVTRYAELSKYGYNPDEIGPEGLAAFEAIDAEIAKIEVSDGRLLPVPLTSSEQASLKNAMVARATHDVYLRRNVEEYAEVTGQTPDEVEAKMLATLKRITVAEPVSTRVAEETLRVILADGKFRNQFETATSRGSYAPDVRAESEAALFGLDPANTPGSQRPVYGYIPLNANDAAMDGSMQLLLDQYGTVAVEFNDAVRERTTFTINDSLGMSARPSPVLNPDTTSVGHLGGAYADGDVDRVATGLDPKFEVLKYAGSAGFVEAQVHGPLRPADIARVVFSERPAQATIDALEARGIEWVNVSAFDNPFEEEGLAAAGAPAADEPLLDDGVGGQVFDAGLDPGGRPLGYVVRDGVRYPDATLATIIAHGDWQPRSVVASASAQFANPWHDELGRFAPKGYQRSGAGMFKRTRSLPPTPVHAAAWEALVRASRLARDPQQRDEALEDVERFYSQLVDDVDAFRALTAARRAIETPHPPDQINHALAAAMMEAKARLNPEFVEEFSVRQPRQLDIQRVESMIGQPLWVYEGDDGDVAMVLNEDISREQAHDVIEAIVAGRSVMRDEFGSSQWPKPGISIHQADPEEGRNNWAAWVNSAVSTTVHLSADYFTLGHGAPEQDMASESLVPRQAWTAAHESGHLGLFHMRNETDSATAARLDRELSNLFEKHSESPFMSSYGRTEPREMHAEAFAEWVWTGGTTTNPVVREYARAFKWGYPYGERPAAAVNLILDENDPSDPLVASGQRHDLSRPVIIIETVEGPPVVLYLDEPIPDEWRGIVEAPAPTLLAPRADFANPWHDHIGRFAPKGTGRMLPDVPFSDVQIAYRPRHPDGHADPGEVVWARVPFEEGDGRSKDRPVLIIGRTKDGTNLVGVQLTSKPGRGRPSIGVGDWDREGRESFLDMTRFIQIDERNYRREGAYMRKPVFQAIVDELARQQGAPRPELAARRGAQFANPWHDQLGRFAPKGTGRMVTSVGFDEMVAAVAALDRSGPGDGWGGQGSGEHQAFLKAIADGEGAFADPAVGQAWISYAGENYHLDINPYLRGYGEAVPETLPMIDKMLASYTPPPARPLPTRSVYRGEVRGLGPTLKPGDTFTDNGFTSVTENSRTAHMFAGELGSDEPWSQTAAPRTIYVITPSSATSSKPVVAVDLPGVDGSEQEWVLPPGSKFKVGSIVEHARQGYADENVAVLSPVVDRIIELEWIE